MAKIIKPSLSSSNVSFKPKVYNFQEQMAKASTSTTQKSMIFEDYKYNNKVDPIYAETGAKVSNNFVSEIFNFIKKEITIKFNNIVEGIKGKIESILKKFKVSYNPNTQTDGSGNVPSSDHNSENQPSTDSQQSPASQEKPTEEQQEEVKPQEEQQPTDEEKPSEETPKPEEKPQEQPTPSKPGYNEALTQDLRNRSDELVVGNGVDTTVRTNCKSYDNSGGTNENHYARDGVLSAKERELLIYLAFHEAGIPGDPVQATAVISSFLNGWETSNKPFNLYMADACSQWSYGDDFGAATQSYRNGTYTYNDVTSLSKYDDIKTFGYYDTLSACVDNVMSGTRNVNSTQWQGAHKNKNGEWVVYRNKNGQQVDLYHAPV